MEFDGKMAHDPKDLLKGYERLRKVIIEYGIQKEDCYNYDKSGFRIGIGDNQGIITFNSKMPAYIPNQQVRDLVTCGETISVNGNKLPPIIIFPAIQIMQNWISDDLPDDYLLAVSDTGYSNDKIHLDWAHHFNKYSARRQKGAGKLLLIDSYGAHMTYEFLHYCEENKIVVFGLIPHTTYLTQPLDIVVFEPFKHFYKQAVNEAVRTGCFKFDRTEFLHVIDLIRRNTFKKNTILSAWKKAGIFLYNPAIAFSQLREWALYQERY